MRRRWMISYGLVLFCSGVFTLWVYTANVNSQKQQELQNSLDWARQTARQAETLSLWARANGIQNPVSWAALQLNRGAENRRVKVFSMKLPDELLQKAGGREFYELREEGKILDYAWLFSPVDRSAVRIEVRLNYRGFFGTQSQMAGEFTGLVFFLFLCGLGIGGVWAHGRMKKMMSADSEVLLRLASDVSLTLRKTHEILQKAKSPEDAGELAAHIRRTTRTLREISGKEIPIKKDPGKTQSAA